MSRNKIFIITGAIISIILVALLIMMQFIEGDASALENSYTIEIQSCSKVAAENELMNELKAALQPSELKGQNGSFMSPLLKINNIKSFGTPIYGMNYIAYYFNAVMYVYSDRKKDTDLFFESYAKSNKAFQELVIEAKKAGKEIKVPFDFENDTTEFIIGKGKADKKKTFNSLQDLRTQLDDLINKGKITKGTTVKVYFICGDLSSLIDTDKDGLMDKDDKCPKDSGKKENNGCPDSDKDGIHDGEDQCPDKAGDKKCFGCKCPPPPPCPGDADDDRDGVCNKSDKCPKQFGNYMGCPDNDRDGVLNVDDKCPNEAGEIKCNGCKCPEPDRDGDGVFDKTDKCPDEFGKSADGCPLKVMIEHDNINGYFLIKGVNITQVKAKLIITQRNGKQIDLDFKDIRLPANDFESKNIFNFFSEGADLEIEVKVFDLNGKLLNSEKFYDISYVCFTREKCGFKKF